MKTLKCCFLLVLLLTAVRLEAIDLTSTDILRISFTTNPGFGGTVPDTFVLFFSPGGISATGVTGYGAELFNGNTLLGTYHRSAAPSGFLAPLFKSSVSPVTALSPTLVDFTTILNGTINGRLDFHLDSGSATFILNDVIL